MTTEQQATAALPDAVPASPAPPWWRLGRADLEVLAWWLLTRLGFFVVAANAPRIMSDQPHLPGLLARWEEWDFLHFDRIATHGYFAPGWPVALQAFFPGFPLVLRGGLEVGIPTVVSGLVSSLIGGGVAAVALGRLGSREYGPRAGRYAAIAWMIAPPAVFLAAPYTESLFLAFALPAWLLARRGRWPAACLLGVGASTVRVSGLFLVAAMGVEFLTSRHRRWRDLPWFLAPLVPIAIYMVYLHAHLGDWLAWYHAEATGKGWYRSITSPATAAYHTWLAATGQSVPPGYEWMYRAELVAMGIGILTCVALAVLHRWGELTWVGLQVLAYAIGYWFLSVPRAGLLWWPLWIGFGALAARRPWVWRVYLVVATPLAVLWATAFLTGRWSG